MANFCCSIDLEPRTLKQGQLHQAREVAVDIIHKKELTESSNIFVEGLKPVAAMREMTAVLVVQETNKQEEEEDCSMDNKTNINKGTLPCQCSRNSSSPIVDSPDQSKDNKEPLSAPF